MEAAKRMILIDEPILESLYSKQDSNWRKPTDQVAKSKLNKQMKTDLVDNNNLPEDVKVKKYNQNLTRFLHTKRKIPIETTPQSDVPVTVPEAQPVVQTATPVRNLDKVAKRKSVKRSRSKLSIPLLTTRVGRIKRAPKKFAWEEW